MVGTTGVANYLNKLYVVNNDSIRVFDSTGKPKDIPFPYDRVSGITMGGNTLFGIYYISSNNANGVFSMDLKSNSFHSVKTVFSPVLIYYIDDQSDGIIIMDDTYQYYRCDKKLKLDKPTGAIPNESIPTEFMTFGLTQTDTNVLFSTDKKIIDLKSSEPLSLVVPGNILSMLYYLDYLFVLYASNYNQFSIIQYDPGLDQIIKTVEGGYLSGPPVYTCIYQNNIYVSASPNQVVSLYNFDIPVFENQLDTQPIQNPYPLFDLPSSDARFIQDTQALPIDSLKTLNETLVLDTRPAEKQLTFSYVWMFFCLTVILVLIALFLFKDPLVLRFGIGILIVSVIFMFSQYI